MSRVDGAGKKFKMIQKIILLILSGGLGALARYGLGGLVQRYTSGSFPWGTVAVNILGCFLFGLFWSWAGLRLSAGSNVRLMVLIGFMGSFTTFSTFAFETTELLAESQWLWAAGNIVLHNGVGIAAMFVGIVIGRCL